MNIRSEIIGHINKYLTAESFIKKSKAFSRFCGAFLYDISKIKKYSLFSESDIHKIRSILCDVISTILPQSDNPLTKNNVDTITAFCDSYSFDYESEPGVTLAVGVNICPSETPKKDDKTGEGIINIVTVGKRFGRSNNNDSLSEVFNRVRECVKKYVTGIIENDTQQGISSLLMKTFDGINEKVTCDVTDYSDRCGGDSIMLPMAMAYISYILGKEKPESFNSALFTGAIDINNKLSVDGVEKKAELIFNEIPWCKSLICPASKGLTKIGSVKITNCDSLSVVLKKLNIKDADILRALIKNITANSREYSVHDEKSTITALLFSYDIIEGLATDEISKNGLAEIVTGYMKHLHTFKYLDRAVKLFEDYDKENYYKNTGVDLRINTIDYAARSYRELMIFDKASELFEILIGFYENGMAKDQKGLYCLTDEGLYKNTLGAYFRCLFEQYFVSENKKAIFEKMTRTVKKRGGDENVEIVLAELGKKDENGNLIDKFAFKMAYYYKFIAALEGHFKTEFTALREDILSNKDCDNDKLNLFLISSLLSNEKIEPSVIEKASGKVKNTSHQTGNISRIQIFYNCAILAIRAGDQDLACSVARSSRLESEKQRKRLDDKIKIRQVELADQAYGNKLGSSLYDIYEYLCDALVSVFDGAEKNPEKPGFTILQSPYSEMINKVEHFIELRKPIDFKAISKVFKPVYLY